MKLFVEHWYPTGVAVGVTATWAWACLAPKDGVHDLLATAVGLAAIVVGFLATAMSIVLAAPDSRIMEQLRASNYIDDLVRYLREPFLVGLALASVALSGYFVSADACKTRLFVGAMVFLTSSLIASMFRIAMVFMYFLKAAAFRAS